MRTFCGGLLQRDIEPILKQVEASPNVRPASSSYSMAEVEKLLTVGTEGNLRAQAFLSCVYGAACVFLRPPTFGSRTWTAFAIACWSLLRRAGASVLRF